MATTAPAPAAINLVRNACHDILTGASFHPIFASPDADVILRSTHGTLYRVDSLVLRATSGLFDTMFSLPQPPSSSSSLPFSEPLDVYEDDFVLETLLRIIHGFPIIHPWSLSTLIQVLYVAEKWDTPGPISALRMHLRQFMEEDPVRCFAIAKHFEWKDEARVAARCSLVVNLAEPKHAERVDDLLCEKDARALRRLHQRRKEVFKELLNSPHRFIAGNSARGQIHCSKCGVTEVSNSTWVSLKCRILEEMDRRPLGDTIISSLTFSSEEGKEGWKEARACWESRCSKFDCGGLSYDQLSTLRQIQACLDVLPDSIDESSSQCW